MDNTEMIKTLRCCAEAPHTCVEDCPRYLNNLEANECARQLVLDAAYALEAQAKRIAELEAKMPKDGE